MTEKIGPEKRSSSKTGPLIQRTSGPMGASHSKYGTYCLPLVSGTSIKPLGVLILETFASCAARQRNS